MIEQISGANQPYKQNNKSETGQECPEKAQKGGKEGETTLQAGVGIPEEKKSDSGAFEEVKVGQWFMFRNGDPMRVVRVDYSERHPFEVEWEIGTSGKTTKGVFSVSDLLEFDRLPEDRIPEWGKPSAKECSVVAEEPKPEPTKHLAKLNQVQPQKGDTVWLPMIFEEDDGTDCVPWKLLQEESGVFNLFVRPDRWHVGENLPVFSQNQDSGGLLGEFRRLAATQLGEIDKLLGVKNFDHEERMMQLEILTSDNRDILAMEKELNEANKLMAKATEELQGHKALVEELAEAKKKIDELQSDLARKDDLIIELRSDNEREFEAGEQFARANFDAFPYADQFEGEIEEALAEQVWRICCAICWESPWNDQGKWQGSLDYLPELRRILNAIYTPKPFDPIRKVVHELTEFETLVRLVNCLIKEERKALFVYRDDVDQEVGK